MNKPIVRSLLLLPVFALCFCAGAQKPGKDLQVVLIRHAEKPEYGDDLTCQGVNRSRALPGVLYAKFGLPAVIYVPSVEGKKANKHERMTQTIAPFADKYHLSLNHDFDVDDAKALAREILQQKGTILVVWEHKRLPDIARALGVEDKLKWPDGDFDGIWIIRIHKGKVSLVRDQEGLRPSTICQ